MNSQHIKGKNSLATVHYGPGSRFVPGSGVFCCAWRVTFCWEVRARSGLRSRPAACQQPKKFESLHEGRDFVPGAIFRNPLDLLASMRDAYCDFANLCLISGKCYWWLCCCFVVRLYALEKLRQEVKPALVAIRRSTNPTRRPQWQTLVASLSRR